VRGHLAEEHGQCAADGLGVRLDGALEVVGGEPLDGGPDGDEPPPQHLTRLVERGPRVRIDGRPGQLRWRERRWERDRVKRILLTENGLRQPQIDDEDEVPERLDRGPLLVDAAVKLLVGERRGPKHRRLQVARGLRGGRLCDLDAGHRHDRRRRRWGRSPEPHAPLARLCLSHQLPLLGDSIA
jgi:hypothetical protein